VSRDLERLLRAAGGTLPEPDDEVSHRARAAVLAGVGRGRRPRGPFIVALVAALVAASAVGFGFGQRIGPERVQGAQPRGVFGAGFLPAEGWSTFQRSRPDGAVALAANVPLAGDDVARAAGTVPSATLRTLPRRGIVIVASFDVRANASPIAARSVPLALRDALAESGRFGDRTLLIRRLRARADAHDLDVRVYFGDASPSDALVGLAERELQRLVVEGPKVTIQVRVTLPAHAPTTLREVDVTGTIASAAAGEIVDVQVKECGPRYRFYRLAGQARTASGGSWRLETKRDGVDVLNLPVNAYYRARWQGSFSTPVVALAPIWAGAAFDRRRRVLTALVDTRPTGQNLRRRFIELQRKVPDTDEWVRVRRARLVRARRPFNRADLFQARFPIRTRGLTMRVFVPAQTGAPCFSAGASSSFTS
jgi:hypothetical protein